MPFVAETPRLKLLRAAPLNSWIVLSDDESSIIAVGSTYEEVSEKIEGAGVTEYVVVKTPRQWTSFSV